MGEVEAPLASAGRRGLKAVLVVAEDEAGVGDGVVLVVEDVAGTRTPRVMVWVAVWSRNFAVATVAVWKPASERKSGWARRKAGGEAGPVRGRMPAALGIWVLTWTSVMASWPLPRGWTCASLFGLAFEPTSRRQRWRWASRIRRGRGRRWSCSLELEEVLVGDGLTRLGGIQVIVMGT